MDLVRYEYQGEVRHGIREGDNVAEIEGDFFGDLQRTGAIAALSDVKLKAPTMPSKILNIAGNFYSHLGDSPPFTRPQPFLAPPSSVIDPGDNIVIPAGSVNVDYEGEIAVIIGKRARKVSVDDAPNHILGICPANDVSERDWQNGDDKDVQWWRAKGGDTFSPFGPWITTGLNYREINLKTLVNGTVVQETNTKDDMVHDIDTTLSFISQHMTLEPGDVIFSGTPQSTTALKPGDVVEVHVDGCGVLSNPVVAEE